jgi:hypothetical protein
MGLDGDNVEAQVEPRVRGLRLSFSRVLCKATDSPPQPEPGDFFCHSPPPNSTWKVF